MSIILYKNIVKYGFEKKAFSKVDNSDPFLAF